MPQNGFPANYNDGHGTELGLCLANPTMCSLLQFVTDPQDGVPFPQNYGGTFPSEAFYWLASAQMDTNNGGKAVLVLALEASFSTGLVLPGDQTTFARLRVRADNLVAGGMYTITTPYGSFQWMATTSGRRGINLTQDFGLIPGDFATALQGNVFPFLRWDSGLPIVDAQGRHYIGNPLIEHTVTGSPTGNNVFRIDGPSVGGFGVNSVSTNLFFVTGQEAVTPPVADFTVSSTSGTAPFGALFTNRSTGAVGSYTWNFGDGGLSHSLNPSHVYIQPGTYTVSLVASGPGGTNTRTMTNLIHVLPRPMTVSVLDNGGAGGRLRLSIANATRNVKLAVLMSPLVGSDPFRQNQCQLQIGLRHPVLQSVKFSGGTGGSVTAEMRIPVGVAGQTCFFQVVDPSACRASNVLGVAF